MGKTDKEIKEIKTRLANIEDAMGLRNDAAANVKLLLDTIRETGNFNIELNQQLAIQTEALQLRNEFIMGTPEIQKDWEIFLKKKHPMIKAEIRRKAAPAKALELTTDDDKIIHAPGPRQGFGVCGAELTPENSPKHGGAITCKECTRRLNENQENKEISTPPPAPAAKTPEQPPQDAGGKIKRADPPRSTVITDPEDEKIKNRKR